MLTYPRPPRPGRRVSTVCVPCRPAPDHARSDARHQRAPGHDRPRAASSDVRRGMTVRAPPLGHRVLTYPWPPRPGRRVSIVCVPRIGRQITSDLAPRQGRRVMADPSPRHPTWRGMTVRAPPLGHRVLTYPWPPRPGRRGQRRLRAMATATVALPAGQHRLRQEACPASLPIPAP